MRNPTKLELALADDGEFVRLQTEGITPKIQTYLDSIATRVCEHVGDRELVEHMAVIYDETSAVYASNPDHGSVPDHLIEFMNHFSPSESVLDIGCGYGRDALFMSILPDSQRAKMMQRKKGGATALEWYGLPSVRLQVTGIDQSQEMISYAWNWSSEYLPMLGACADFERYDMHFLKSFHYENHYDGAWSSAALFMHTPPSLVLKALDGVHHILRRDGLFALSYANNATDESYHNLRYSRTREVKYFSRPTPGLIRSCAQDVGLELVSEDYSDLVMGSVVKPSFFVTQMYRKL